jgi:hypothetical protein
MKNAGSVRAAALFSADGRHWPAAPTFLPASSGAGAPVFSNALTLLVGDDGMVASGIGGAGGATVWWRSSDGQRWQALDGFPASGATTCSGAACGTRPNGILIGDGHQIVAWTGGSGAAALVSTDGERWSALSLTGDVPDGPTTQATQATLLPGGVLISDGTTTWFGKAEGN